MRTENSKYHFGLMKRPLAIFCAFEFRNRFYFRQELQKIVFELLLILLLINDERRE